MMNSLNRSAATDDTKLEMFYKIPIVLKKIPIQNPDGTTTLKCGFRIGGGIDQDYKKSPHGYKDNGVYVTFVQESSPAGAAGLQIHDKILQVNGYDFTMVTHKKAVEYIQKFDILNMLVTRQGVPPLQ